MACRIYGKLNKTFQTVVDVSADLGAKLRVQRYSAACLVCGEDRRDTQVGKDGRRFHQGPSLRI